MRGQRILLLTRDRVRRPGPELSGQPSRAGAGCARRLSYNDQSRILSPRDEPMHLLGDDGCSGRRVPRIASLSRRPIDGEESALSSAGWSS